jgi:hypothetical protein
MAIAAARVCCGDPRHAHPKATFSTGLAEENLDVDRHFPVSPNDLLKRKFDASFRNRKLRLSI